MIMRRLFIGLVILLGLLALGGAWTTYKQLTDYARGPTIYNDIPTAQAAGVPRLDHLQKIIPNGSRVIIVARTGRIGGDFDFPSGEFTALKQRASQINGSVVKENPEDSSTTISFPAQEKEFRMTVRPDPHDPALLHAWWDLIDEQ